MPVLGVCFRFDAMMEVTICRGLRPQVVDGAAFQFHGGSSSSRVALWSLILASMSASQARGSTSLSRAVTISE